MLVVEGPGQGEGIPEDQIELVFYEISRVEKKAAAGCRTGLGLSIAKKTGGIARGSISAGQHTGPGHYNSFTLPLSLQCFYIINKLCLQAADKLFS